VTGTAVSTSAMASPASMNFEITFFIVNLLLGYDEILGFGS
jgi:hypothetical protein